jgi:flagellar FliL protein
MPMATNPKRANRDEQDEAKAKPTFKQLLPKILLWSFIGLNLALMAGGTMVIYKLKIANHRPDITEQTESEVMAKERDLLADHPVLFSFEPFTINLDGRPRKLVRTTIQLEMLSETGYEEAVDLTPVERDEIVRIFNSKKLEDIETIQGKLFLKDQIMTAMNGLLHKGMVKEVYFGDFIIQ